MSKWDGWCHKGWFAPVLLLAVGCGDPNEGVNEWRFDITRHTIASDCDAGPVAQPVVDCIYFGVKPENGGLIMPCPQEPHIAFDVVERVGPEVDGSYKAIQDEAHLCCGTETISYECSHECSNPDDCGLNRRVVSATQRGDELTLVVEHTVSETPSKAWPEFSCAESMVAENEAAMRCTQRDVFEAKRRPIERR